MAKIKEYSQLETRDNFFLLLSEAEFEDLIDAHIVHFCDLEYFLNILSKQKCLRSHEHFFLLKKRLRQLCINFGGLVWESFYVMIS